MLVELTKVNIYDKNKYNTYYNYKKINMQSSGTGAAEVEQLDFLSRLEREADRTDPSSSSRQVQLHSENKKHNVVHVMNAIKCVHAVSLKTRSLTAFILHQRPPTPCLGKYRTCILRT